MKLKKIIISGAPGTGKSSIIKELKEKGYFCFDEVWNKEYENPTNKSNINDIDLSEVLIYPVPAKEYLYISIENGNHFEVQILSLDGRKVLSQKSSLNDITIDVSSILKGNYLIKIHNIESNNFITKKISIQ